LKVIKAIVIIMLRGQNTETPREFHAFKYT